MRSPRRRAVLLALGAAGVAVACALLIVAAMGASGSPPQAEGQATGTVGRLLPRDVPATAPGAHRAPREAVPVLMYHVIEDPPPDRPFRALYVTEREFWEQMNALARAGYHGVTLDQVHDAWHAGGLLPSKPIVVSFDDGYRSHVTTALPVLRDLGWPGVLFLKLGNLRDELPAADVRRLIRGGWEIDAHTVTHPDLTTIDGEGLEREIAGAREELRRRFGVPVNFFAYPAGRHDAAARAAVRAAGHRGAVTTEPGLARREDPFTLARIRVNGGDTPDDVLAAVRAAGA